MTTVLVKSLMITLKDIEIQLGIFVKEICIHVHVTTVEKR